MCIRDSTNVVLTSAAKGQSTLAEHLSRSGYGIQDDGGDTDSTGDAVTAGNETGDAGTDNGDEDPPRRRRRGRGRSSETADVDESAHEILRAAYRSEVAAAGDNDRAPITSS